VLGTRIYFVALLDQLGGIHFEGLGELAQCVMRGSILATVAVVTPARSASCA
jgi:hypothetical protein